MSNEEDPSREYANGLSGVGNSNHPSWHAGNNTRLQELRLQEERAREKEIAAGLKRHRKALEDAQWKSTADPFKNTDPGKEVSFADVAAFLAVAALAIGLFVGVVKGLNWWANRNSTASSTTASLPPPRDAALIQADLGELRRNPLVHLPPAGTRGPFRIPAKGAHVYTFGVGGIGPHCVLPPGEQIDIQTIQARHVETFDLSTINGTVPHLMDLWRASVSPEHSDTGNCINFVRRVISFPAALVTTHAPNAR